MKAIYEPTGKAREFGDLACNLYLGCSHGCDYCYAPGILRMNREEFSNPVPRHKILEQLKKDAKKHKGSRIPIFLSFTSDPYQPIENSITRAAINILYSNGCAINVLTKGGMRATSDFDILAANPDSWFGTTLTYWNEAKSKNHEPNAASPKDRICAIKEAKRAGIKTWVSMEPITSGEEAFELLYQSFEFVDLFKIGKMNHRKGISEKELRHFLSNATETLDRHDKDYYIKLDTKPYLNSQPVTGGSDEKYPKKSCKCRPL